MADMSKTATNRQQEGLVIANSGTIKRISELKYIVKSQNGGGAQRKYLHLIEH